MSRFRHAVKDRDQHIQTLRIACAVLAFFLLFTCAGWMLAPSKLIVHNPPDLRTGSTRPWWEVPLPTVYSFAFYIFQQLNAWPKNGEVDYSAKINALSPYLTPSCQDFLKEDSSHCFFDVSWNEKNYDIGFIYCDYMAKNRAISEVEYLSDFQESLELAIQRPVKLLAGKKVSDISGLAKSYSTACVLNSLEAFRAKKKMYFYEEEVQIHNGGIILCKQSLDALISAIEQNDKIQIRKCVENLYEEMRQMGLAADTVNLNINYFLFQLIYLATEQDDCVDQKEILHFIGESTFEEGVTRGSSVHMVHFALEYAEYLAQLRKNISRGDVIRDVEKEIRENYAENLTLRELSKKYYVNSAYLGQIFRKKFGQSFKEYLNNYRMEQAVQRLLYTSDKIYQIALDVGYKDCDYFINRFIAAKGCTPAKFRRQGGVLKN